MPSPAVSNPRRRQRRSPAAVPRSSQFTRCSRHLPGPHPPSCQSLSGEESRAGGSRAKEGLQWSDASRHSVRSTRTMPVDAPSAARSQHTPPSPLGASRHRAGSTRSMPATPKRGPADSLLTRGVCHHTRAQLLGALASFLARLRQCGRAVAERLLLHTGLGLFGRRAGERAGGGRPLRRRQGEERLDSLPGFCACSGAALLPSASCQSGPPRRWGGCTSAAGAVAAAAAAVAAPTLLADPRLHTSWPSTAWRSTVPSFCSLLIEGA